MIELLILAILLAVLGGTFAFWRAARLRQLSRERLSEPEEAVEFEPPPEPVFVRAHYWLPWTLAVLTTGMLFFLLHWPAVFALTFGLMVGLLGSQLAAYRVNRINLQMEEQLADAVDLMVATLRAGAGVLKALEFALLEARPPLRQQLEEVLGRIRLGNDPQHVLQSLEERVPLEPFRLFAAALSVHWETGGSLTPALAVVGRVIRDRIEVNRRIRALGAQARASTIAVLALTYFIGLVMWRNNPDGVQGFLTTTMGQFLLAGIVLLQVVGLVWSAALSRLKY